jgi:hypothetical protein
MAWTFDGVPFGEFLWGHAVEEVQVWCIGRAHALYRRAPGDPIRQPRGDREGMRTARRDTNDREPVDPEAVSDGPDVVGCVAHETTRLTS